MIIKKLQWFLALLMGGVIASISGLALAAEQSNFNHQVIEPTISFAESGRDNRMNKNNDENQDNYNKTRREHEQRYDQNYPRRDDFQGSNYETRRLFPGYRYDYDNRWYGPRNFGRLFPGYRYDYDYYGGRGPDYGFGRLFPGYGGYGYYDSLPEYGGSYYPY